MRQLQDDVSKSFLVAIRMALTSSAEIAAKIFAAWHTSKLPACRELVEEEMRGSRNGDVLSDISRFVYFVFWRANAVERRASGLLRLQVSATVEKLYFLVSTGKWVVPDDVSIAEILTKIEHEGGITKIYDSWRRRQLVEKKTQLYQLQEAKAEKLGVQVEEVQRRERETRDRHQQRRDDQNDARFLEMLTDICEEIAWDSDDPLMLIAATRSPDGRLNLRKLRTPYRRRMITAIVNPTTPIV